MHISGLSRAWPSVKFFNVTHNKVEINFQAQDRTASAWCATPANRNLDKLRVHVSVLLDRKRGTSSQPVPKCQGSSRSSHPKPDRLTMWPQPIRYLFLVSSLFFFFFFLNSCFYLFIYLFIYFWLCWVFGSCEGFLQLRRAGATLHRSARASHRRGLPCCGAQAPDAQAQ